MSQIFPTFQVEKTSDDTSWKNWMSWRRVYELLARIINGNISFGNGTASDNINGGWFTVITPGAPNTDFTIVHNLQRVAVGYLIMTKSAACDVYTSPTVNPNPTTQIILRATTGTTTLSIFVL